MAVHEVLDGEKPAATALADLQTELMRITGMKAPAPGAKSGRQGEVSYLRRAAMRDRLEDGLNEVNMTLGAM